MANDPDRNQPDRNQPDRNNPEREGEGDVATVIKPKVDKPPRYKVVLHNDDYTTMEFVVMILMRFFHKSEPEATHIMLSVHHRGYGVCGYYPRDIAETKVAQVNDFANEHGMPLKITAEPELRGRCASVLK